MRILLPLLMLSTLSFGQNKKEQIALLSSRVDSLKTLLDKERDYSSSQIRNLNSTIERLMVDSTRSDDKIKFQGNQIIFFEKVIDSLNLILTKTSKQLDSLREQILALEEAISTTAFDDGLQRWWHENGQLRSEGNYKDGVKDGVHRWWFDDGELEFEGNYKNGKKDGVHRWRGDNGYLMEESNWKDGKADGVFREWYINGELESEANYKDGNLDGIERYWYDDGQLEVERNWKDGKLIDDKVAWYFWDGTIYKTEYYEDGEMTSCEGNCD